MAATASTIATRPQTRFSSNIVSPSSNARIRWSRRSQRLECTVASGRFLEQPRSIGALVYRPTHESLDAGSVRDATGRVAGVRHRCRGHRPGHPRHRAAAVVRAGADPGRAVRVRRAAGGRAVGQRRVGGGRGGVDARLQLLLPAAALHVHPGRPQQLVLAGGVPRHRRRRQRAGVAVAAARHRVGAAGRDRHLPAATGPGHGGARPHRRGGRERARGGAASASSWAAPPRPAGRPTPS